jgi:hypothetical protein
MMFSGPTCTGELQLPAIDMSIGGTGVTHLVVVGSCALAFTRGVEMVGISTQLCGSYGMQVSLVHFCIVTINPTLFFKSVVFFLEQAVAQRLHG